MNKFNYFKVIIKCGYVRKRRYIFIIFVIKVNFGKEVVSIVR